MIPSGPGEYTHTEPNEVPCMESNDYVKPIRRGGRQIHIVTSWVGRKGNTSEGILVGPFIYSEMTRRGNRTLFCEPASIQKKLLAQLKNRNVNSPCLDCKDFVRPSGDCSRVTKVEDVVLMLCFGLETDFFFPPADGGGAKSFGGS